MKLEEDDEEDDDEIKDMDEDVLDDELALPVSLIGNNDDDYINECYQFKLLSHFSFMCFYEVINNINHKHQASCCIT